MVWKIWRSSYLPKRNVNNIDKNGIKCRTRFVPIYLRGMWTKYTHRNNQANHEVPIYLRGMWTAHSTFTWRSCNRSYLPKRNVNILIFWGILAIASRVPIYLRGMWTKHWSQYCCMGCQVPIYLRGMWTIIPNPSHNSLYVGSYLPKRNVNAVKPHQPISNPSRSYLPKRNVNEVISMLPLIARVSSYLPKRNVNQHQQEHIHQLYKGSYLPKRNVNYTREFIPLVEFTGSYLPKRNVNAARTMENVALL